MTVSKKAKRKPGRPRVERIWHVIEIVDWTWDLTFGIANTKFRDGPYEDYRHLILNGKIIRPLRLPTTDAEITVFPSQRLNEAVRDTIVDPKAVGWISQRGKNYSASLHIPAETLAPVLQMLIAGKYRYVRMEASKSFRGEAEIRLFSFTGIITEDDLHD